VLDDLGKERTSEARLDYLYQIIDYRYRHGLQTVVTTNALDMEGLKNKWNSDSIEPIVSRLLENGAWVTIRSAKNYRTNKPST
jgi:DNA replication protein DnaC